MRSRPLEAVGYRIALRSTPIFRIFSENLKALSAPGMGTIEKGELPNGRNLLQRQVVVAVGRPLAELPVLIGPPAINPVAVISTTDAPAKSLLSEFFFENTEQKLAT